MGWHPPLGKAMVDSVSPEVRSRIMAQVRSKDTKPELTVRRFLHGLGFRYRLHGKDLPGRPDLVFRSRRKAIFVHGCFWHGHANCEKARLPSSNRDYWLTKMTRNRERDERNIALLQESGWETMVVWECELADMETVSRDLIAFLE